MPDLAGSASYDPSTVLVTFRPGAAPAPALAGTTVGPELDPATGLYEVQLSAGVSVASALAAYQADPQVLTAEPNTRVSAAWVPNDPSFSQQWDMNNIQAPGAWGLVTGTYRTVVAVVDSGIDYNHPDLYRNVWLNEAEIPTSRRKNLIDVDGDGRITFADLNDPRNQGVGKITDVNHDGRIDAADVLAPMVRDAAGHDTGQGGWAYPGNTQDGDTAHPNDFVGWNFVDNTNDPFDDNGHGTHVSGTIGAIGNNRTGVAGVNWKVQLMPLKFLDSNADGYISDAIDALNYAVAHGARISNNSWVGAPNDQSLYDAIQNAGAHGHIFVAAAGNDGANLDSSPTYPASYNLNNIVSVAASDPNNNLAGFSNYGAHSVDLAAPGVNVFSTYKGGGYATMIGTSMATPHVTGVLALVWGERPEWTYTQVINQVLSTVDKEPGLQGKTVSGGRLNASAAVHVPPRTTAASTTTHTAVSRPAASSSTTRAASASSDPSPLTPVAVTSTGEVHSTSVTVDSTPPEDAVPPPPPVVVSAATPVPALSLPHLAGAGVAKTGKVGISAGLSDPRLLLVNLGVLLAETASASGQYSTPPPALAGLSTRILDDLFASAEVLRQIQTPYWRSRQPWAHAVPEALALDSTGTHG